jgi:hypothetical protein
MAKFPTWRYRRSVGVGRQVSAVVEPVRRPHELDDFVGKWVAVKDHRVIAAAATSSALVYEVHKLGNRGEGAVAQYVPPPDTAFMVGVG